MNILNLFDVLRLSNAGVSVAWIDGFATDETSGACVRAAGVQFTELACPEVNAIARAKSPNTTRFLILSPSIYGTAMSLLALPHSALPQQRAAASL